MTNPDGLTGFLRKCVIMLCQCSEDYLHPAHKLSTKRVVFIDDHGQDNGPARTAASVMSEVKASWKDNLIGSTACLNSSNSPRDILYLRGGIQGLITRFPSLCVGLEGARLQGYAGGSKSYSSRDRLDKADENGTTEEDHPWLYSDALAGLNDSILDPSVTELLKKRMSIQMAIMSMISAAIPVEDPPRLVLHHANEWQARKTEDASSGQQSGVAPHPFLYIGSQESAKPKYLKSFNITHVIRLGNCRWPYPACNGVNFHDFPIDDVPSARISSLFPTTTALLDGIRIRGERALVHCQAGVSRSASIVLAFILRRGTKGAAGGLPSEKKGKASTVSASHAALPAPNDVAALVSPGTTLREAFQVLHHARPIICPNPGFWSELEQYERVLQLAAANTYPLTNLGSNSQITQNNPTSSLPCLHSKGNIALVNHALSLVFTFQAYQGPVTHMKVMRNKNILVTIGDDEAGIPVVKVWNLDKMDKTNRGPMLTRSTKVQHGNKIFPVTALAVLDNMSQIAVGLENGVVLLIRGDISRDRFTKTKVIHESSELVTGLGFHEDVRSTSLYIVTLAKVLICPTSTKEITSTLEESGADVGCTVSTQQESGQHIVVGREEAVYFYGPDGRGPCFIIEGSKISMTWFRNYLVIISKDIPLPQPAAETERNLGSAGSLRSNGNAEEEALGSEYGTILTVYDLKCKLIAFRGTFGGEKPLPGVSPKRVTEIRQSVPIKCVTSEWGELFVVTADNHMYRLSEKDLTTKLDILFKKNLYNLAISMVSPSPTPIPGIDDSKTVAAASNSKWSDEYDHSTVVEVHKRYGDFLYTKADYDGATTQYTHTIGSLEPSYVIRKFLDAQRIHNLTSYLQSLHDAGLANEDHTTLLINCYTKMKDMARLDVFIKGSGAGASDRGGGGSASFDVETAMRVCRQAGYYDHALWLAKRFKRHTSCLQILVEDLRRFQEAVDYVASLAPHEQEEELKRYGPTLVTELPEEMTNVLIRLCTTPVVKLKPRLRGIQKSLTQASDVADVQKASLETVNGDPNAAEADPPVYLKAEDFLHLYVIRPDWCVKFLEKVLEVRWAVSFNLKGKSPAIAEFPPLPGEGAMEDSEELASLEIVCKTVLELLIGPLGNNLKTSEYKSEETVGDVTPTVQTAVKNSELITAAVAESLLGTREDREAKALNLLRHPRARYDLDQALVLCYSNSFREGTLYVYSEIVRYHIEEDDYAGVVDACKRFGEIDSSLWPQALTFFAERGTGLVGRSEAQANLNEILDAIERKNLMPPLKVLEILAKNSAVTIGMVRDYVVRRMEAERRIVDESRKLIEQYRSETARMRAEIDELENSPVVFQATKCSLCSQPLELPTVHFMCKHSYHARCLGEGGLLLSGQQGEKECPRCAPEHRMILDMVNATDRGQPDHDLFLAKLDDKGKDRFSVIADYFGRNVFSMGLKLNGAE
ncbi:Vacuolar protein sorting-associated protein 11 [Phlyctochytrium bullatum]|nr:Vacuolar protein sorting-associated protein 11 [Phlyctochytrium bullatum]